MFVPLTIAKWQPLSSQKPMEWNRGPPRSWTCPGRALTAQLLIRCDISAMAGARLHMQVPSHLGMLGKTPCSGKVCMAHWTASVPDVQYLSAVLHGTLAAAHWPRTYSAKHSVWCLAHVDTLLAHCAQLHNRY